VGGKGGHSKPGNKPLHFFLALYPAENDPALGLKSYTVSCSGGMTGFHRISRKGEHLNNPYFKPEEFEGFRKFEGSTVSLLLLSNR
jgi:hypothetical protein